MNVSRLAEVIEVNLFYAKSELCQMADPSAPARALRHIEGALKELRAVQRQAAKPPTGKTEAA
ncbi:hypothetical protein CCR94_16080 [Rhodoblastus sphagnicola]|uniref:Uncharacterized protein n=1 Tax=Rhodoblastus sphagnicola TaxID=333368 RepID=A0A2S6N3C9_9HYPH|nr:hypothetical protein [Rhodoblastus sphagnicola]MBB4200852.1 hypothetical protein [Rhodoblastus sphagnicola]PPQ29118.1 hypothetical protein CCR94_16080 [Rhodoblastus sphagnicola]